MSRDVIPPWDERMKCASVSPTGLRCEQPFDHDGRHINSETSVRVQWPTFAERNEAVGRGTWIRQTLESVAFDHRNAYEWDLCERVAEAVLTAAEERSEKADARSSQSEKGQGAPKRLDTDSGRPRSAEAVSGHDV